jgi:virulence-associated protein E
MTVYVGARANVPAAQDDLTWDQFCDELEGMINEAPAAPPSADRDEQKRTMLAWSPHRLREGTTRALANVEAITALAIDVDGCDASVVDRIDHAALVYGSPSDDADRPTARRLRIVAPITRELAPDECERARFAFAERLGLAPGCGVEGAKDASRLFFAGRLHGTPERDVARFDGAPVDVDALLATPLAHDWSVPKALALHAPGNTAIVGNTTDRVARVVGIMYPHYAAGGRHELCRALGGWLARYEQGPWSDDEIAAVVRALPSDKVDARVSQALLAAAQARAGETTIGWQALSSRLGPDAERLECAARSEWWARQLAAPDPDALAFVPPEAAPDVLVLDRDKQGRPLRTTLNVYRVVEHALDGKVWRDTMRGRILCLGIDDSLGHFPEGPWRDVHTTALKMLCETLGLMTSTSAVHEAIESYADEHERNPWADHLLECAAKWDGVARVDMAMSTYWGAADTPATRAASRVFLLSIAARGLEPGVKVDTVPILIGEQGTYKSTSLRLLVGPGQFSDSPLAIGDKDALQNIRGKALWELSELASMMRKDENAMKAFLSAQEDTFRASYGRHSEDVPRTCIFAGTSNPADILRDPTGARRYMVVTCGRIDLAALERDREQILGEAAWRVCSGEQHWPTDAEARALADVASDHHDEDPWLEPIAAWLEQRSAFSGMRFANGETWLTDGAPPAGPFEIGDVFGERGPVPIEIGRLSKGDQMRAANVLRRLDCEKRRIHGTMLWACPKLPR